MIDHLVYGTRDVEATVAELERLTGVRAAPGGRHPGRGTRNALLGLGHGRYLEIIGPDPLQSGTTSPLPFGLDYLTGPRLVTWAARADDLEKRIASARAAGYDPGDILPRSRERPDGRTLKWRLTSLGLDHPDWLVPFLIDWQRSQHPSDSAPAGLTLVELRATHPEPDHIRRILAALGVDLPIARGSRGSLLAKLETPRGRVDLD
ncbi:MAG: VOC family protein [SAR202 cluster bacterium]|nr:VOC family protein [SAR202 cluster bacterium]